MADLPNWVLSILILMGTAFVLAYLRALAAAAEDSLGVHRLHHEAAVLQIRQFKQLKAIQLGIHPGDIFTSDDRLDMLIADAESRITGDGTMQADQQPSAAAFGNDAQPESTPPESTQKVAPEANPAPKSDIEPDPVQAVVAPAGQRAPEQRRAA